MQAIAFGDVADTEILKLLELFHSILKFYCTIYKRKKKEEKQKITRKPKHHRSEERR